MKRLFATLVLVVGLAGGGLAGPGSAGSGLADPASPPDVGSNGAGDPYFPHDGNGGYDVRRYVISNTVPLGGRRGTGSLRGRTVIRATATAPVRRLNVDLRLHAAAVRFNGHPVRFGKPNAHELQVHLPRPLRVGERFALTVRYYGRPGQLAWQGERPWFGNREEVVSIGQPHIAPWWFAANDHPSDAASVRVTIRVPAGKQVISNGRLVGRTLGPRWSSYTWTAAPMASYLAFFAAGDYRVQRGVSGGLRWVNAVSERLGPRGRRAATRMLAHTPRIVRWLSRRIDQPYPFGVTGGVVTGLNHSFALENQTRPIYPALDESKVARDLIVHELAHQWFGDDLRLARWSDIWLNEGFATFFSVAYREHLGEQSARAWLRAAYRRERADFWQTPIGDPGRDLLFDWAVYQRGAMTLQALRQRIGERTFWRLISQWAGRHQGRAVTAGQFTALAEEISGQDLTDFFRVWLHEPRRPARTAANGLG